MLFLRIYFDFTLSNQGFNLYLNDQNILGFSADSGFNEAVYKKIYEASTVVVDAREGSTKEHASVSVHKINLKIKCKRLQ